MNRLDRLAVIIQNPKTKIFTGAVTQDSTLAVWLGLFVVTVHLTLLPFVARAWRTTGDEPHYLLAAHSLVADHDFDLANNYDQLDYLNFYLSKDITRQIRLDRSGAQILDHQLGFPLLIAPAYALGGRLGVLVFQAVVGGVLAGVMFHVAVFMSGHRPAALLATLFVALSSPLFLYHYLVYPELLAALLTTVVIYIAIRQDKPTRYSALIVFLSLALLPWLNRRFAVLAFVLALLVAWAWWGRESRLPKSQRLRKSYSAILGIIITGLSIGLLLWFNQGLMAAERVDITLPAGGGAFWLRLARGVGWLVDQQRGLLIYGPIYIAAILGLPYLWQKTGTSPCGKRGWFVIAPFLVSLGVTTLAGGFWIAWEVGPRFLVVALPALTPLLALAWQHYRRSLAGRAGILCLFGLSLLNSGVVMTHAELPYKSSLPLFYSQALSFPLTEYLPDLGEQLEIVAAEGRVSEAELVSEEAGLAWFAAVGQPVSLVQTEPLARLPFGHYRLTSQLRTDPNLPPETELLHLSVQTLGGGHLFSQVITAADLPADGRYGELTYTFLNSNVDRWRTPLLLHAVSTGQSNVWLKQVAFHPAPLFAWILPYVYLGLCFLAAGLTWQRSRSDRLRSQDGLGQQAILPYPPAFSPPFAAICHSPSAVRHWSWALALLLPVAALGYLVIQHIQPSRTYDVVNFLHFAGQPINDVEATDGRAWLVDPMTDPPQKAIYGPFDFFEPGLYHIGFRIKLVEETDPEREVARLRVGATTNFDELITQPLLGSNFSEPDLYHLFVLTVNNPRRQALSFEVDYTGEAALLIDEVTVEEDMVHWLTK